MTRLAALTVALVALALAAIVPWSGAAAPAASRQVAGHGQHDCAIDFPPRPLTFSRLTLVGITCDEPVKELDLTLPKPITDFSKWAVASPGSLSTGTCGGEHTTTATCALGAGMATGSKFLLSIGPALTVGEQIKLKVTPAREPAWIRILKASAGPKLTVKTTITPDPSTTAAPGTAFDFVETIVGGPFYQLQFNLPANDKVLVTLAEPTNGLQCGAPVAGGFTCFELGVKPIQPGTFKFAVQVTQPIAAGTDTACKIWGTGLQQGSCTLHWP
jgi:hypothetical protein